MIRRNVFAGLVVASFATAVAFPLYAALYLWPSFLRLVNENEQREAERVAVYLSERFFPGDGGTPLPEITPAFRAELSAQLVGYGLERIKAFAPDGTVVFSSDPAEEGTRNTRPYFHEIVARGRTHVAVTPRQGKTPEGRTVNADVVEVYAPVMRGERFVGAFEVYHDVTGWTRGMRRLIARSGLVVLLMTGGFLAGIVLLSRRAARAVRQRDQAAEALQQERDRLEAAVGERTEALRRSHDDLERLVAERSSALEAANRRLHDLSGHLQSAREEERTRIAREVHDELAQSLTAMRMELSLLRRGLPADQTQNVERAISMSALVDSTAQAVKRISQDLRPGILDHLGISAAIEWQGEEFERRTGIPCGVTVEPGEIVLDEERSTAVFRIFQEALTNVARHAEAREVSVLLRRDAAGIVLQVRDNGRGMEERRAPGRCFGIIGIQERVRAWGGSVEIASKHGEGTTVTVRLPSSGAGGAA